MLPFLLTAWLAGQGAVDCGNVRAALASPVLHRSTDLAEAGRRLAARPDRDCAELRVAVAYLEGLVAAERAWRLGGGPDAVAPVRARIAELTSLSASAGRSADLAGLVLSAQIASAQNEAAEMALLIEQAFDLELQLRLAGLPGLPIVSAHEAAGDCWLRLFRYADALRAFEEASRGGANPRVDEGLRRARAGLAARVPR